MELSVSYRRRVVAIVLISMAMAFSLEAYFEFSDGRKVAAISLAALSVTVVAAALLCDSARFAAYFVQRPIVVAVRKRIPFPTEVGPWLGALVMFAAAASCYVYSTQPNFALLSIASESAAVLLVVSGFGVLLDHHRWATTYAVWAGFLCFVVRGGLLEMLHLCFASFWGLGFLLMFLPLFLLALIYWMVWPRR